MSEIEDLKNKLSLDEMDKETRDKIFNRFVEKGGEVIKEKKPIIKNVKGRRQPLSRAAQKEKSTQSQGQQKKDYTYKYSYNTTAVNKKKHYFRIYFTGVLQGVFSISGFFAKNFSSDMHEKLPKIVSELNTLTEELLNISPEKKWYLVDLINKTHSYSFELVLRTNRLFDKKRFSRISDYFEKKPYIICPRIIDDLKYFFKELLIIYPYWESIKESIWKFQQFYQDITSVNPLFSKSRINKNIDRLFSYYLPRIFTVLNYNLGEKIPFEYKLMHKFIKISPEEDIGSMTEDLVRQKTEYYEKQKREKEERLKKLQEEIDQKEIDKIPKYIQKGLTMIDSIKDRIPELSEENPKMKLFEQNEKMLEFYALFNIFDQTYSFIMTTSQIKLTPKLENGLRIDIKSDLESQYILFNEILTHIKEYFNLLDHLKKLKDNTKISTFHIQQQKTSNLKSKRIQSFNEIRVRTSNFFKKLAIILQKVIKDYDSEKRLIQNGDDRLEFHTESGERHKFEDETIINTILITFSFVSAMHYYMTKGKLSEKGLYFHNEDIDDNSNEEEPATSEGSDPTEKQVNGQTSEKNENSDDTTPSDPNEENPE